MNAPASTLSAGDLATARLVVHLLEADLHGAAALVRHELRRESSAVLADVKGAPCRWQTPGSAEAWRSATAAIVKAWARGDAAAVGRAFDAWNERGCEDCAEQMATYGHRCADPQCSAQSAGVSR